MKLKKQHDDKVAQENLDEAKALAEKLGSAQVNLGIKMGEGGRSFGSVSSKEISEAAKKQLGYDIDKKKIQLKDAIKAPGTFEVSVKLHTKVTATLKVVVSEEK